MLVSGYTMIKNFFLQYLGASNQYRSASLARTGPGQASIGIFKPPGLREPQGLTTYRFEAELR